MLVVAHSRDRRNLRSAVLPLNPLRIKPMPGNSKHSFIMALASVLFVCGFDLQAKAQTGSPQCAAASLGALIGTLINPRANASAAIPDHCRGNGQTRESNAAPTGRDPVNSDQIKINKSNLEIMMEVDRVGPYRGRLLQDTY
jgi:hypothetical protein